MFGAGCGESSSGSGGAGGGAGGSGGDAGQGGAGGDAGAGGDGGSGGLGGEGGTGGVEPIRAALVLVANAGDQSLSVLDAETLEPMTDNIPLSIRFPWFVTASEDGRTAYVSCSGTGTVENPGGISIVDLESFVEVATVALSGTDPSESVVIGDTLYVSFVDDSGADDSDLLSVVDLSATPPVEVDVLELNSHRGFISMSANPQATTLYLGGHYWDLTTVDISGESPIEGASIHTGQEIIRAQHMTEDGTLYVGGRGFWYEDRIVTYDTQTDQFGSPIHQGSPRRYVQGIDTTNDALVIAGSPGFFGKLAYARPDGFQMDTGDDSCLTVPLPFQYTFEGVAYDEVYMDSNGLVRLTESGCGDFPGQGGTDLDSVLGFAPFYQDMDSSDGLIAYQVQTFDDRAVFQWLTPTYGSSRNPSAVCSFELTLFSNGGARFDYDNCGPDAISDDRGFGYGIANGSDVLVNLRPTVGSPFALTQVSYAWDPSVPDTVTSLPFAWERLEGAQWTRLPGIGRGLATLGSRAFVPIPRSQKDGGATDQVAVVDLATLDVTSYATGGGPRGVAVAPPVYEE